MNFPRLATFAVCFTVIHENTIPAYRLPTLAAIIVICILVAFDRQKTSG